MASQSRTPAGNIWQLGTHGVTHTVADGSGNQTTCTNTVTVTDSIKPTLTCTPDTTLAADAQCQATFDPSATAADNCDSVASPSRVPAGNIWQLGATDVTHTVADGSSNQTTCTALVVVTDNTPPAVTCPAKVVLEANDLCTQEANPVAKATDNCDSAPTFTRFPGGNTWNLGQTTVTHTASGQCIRVNGNIKYSGCDEPLPK